MSVRAKFTCTSISKLENYDSDGDNTEVCFSAVTESGGDSEQFWKYTPSGELSMCIKNEAAVKYFEPGKVYYLDFTAAEG